MNFRREIKDFFYLLAEVLLDDPLEVHQGPDVGVEAPKVNTKLDAWQVLVS